VKRLALLLLLAGCATGRQALPVTGQSLVTIEAQYEVTNDAFVALCRPSGATPAVLAVATCDDYRAFRVRFLAGFHLARLAFDDAVKGGPGVAPADWSALVEQLASFVHIVLTVHPAATPVP
jgi:hypothetical protein